MLQRITACLVGCLLAGAVWGAAPAAPEAGSVIKVLRTSNKAQTNRYVSDTLEFKNINPFNVINFLWAPLSREEGGIYSFVNPNGESGFVVIICPEYQLESLRKLAADLDRPKLTSAPGSKYIYYRLRHRNVADPGFLSVASYYMGSSGVLLPDVETNSVLIFDAAEGANAAERDLMGILDRPLTQVDIGLKIFEVSVTNDGTLGLDYTAWKNGPGRLLGQLQATGSSFNVVGGGNSHTNQSAGGYYLNYPSAFFDFMVEKGKAKLLTDTRIAALNRVPAMLTTGEQVQYNVVSDPMDERTLDGRVMPMTVDGLTFPTNNRVFSGGNVRSPLTAGDPSFAMAQYPQQGRKIQSSIATVDTGVQIAVVPTVGEQVINLDMNLKVISLTGSDGAGNPLLNSREMTDSIAVANGETIVFGGLTRERSVQTTRRIPLLGSLPGIGFLFGNEVTTTHKSIVVMAVTPTLIGEDGNVSEADRQLARKASGEEVVVLPKTEFCFEQNMPAQIF